MELMEGEMQLETAKQKAIEIAEALNGRNVNGDARSRLCAVCFAVSQQHHNSILILLSQSRPLEATAFALLRPLLEAVIRGLWLLHVAADEQINSYAKSGTKLDMASMIKAVGNAAGVDAHKSIYKHWSALSAYTHTGEHQVQRWMLTGDIEPSYSSEELCELLRLSDIIAEMAFQSVLSISSERK